MSRRVIASSRDRLVLLEERREVRRFWGEKMGRLNGWIMNVLNEPGAGDGLLRRWAVRMDRGI